MKINILQFIEGAREARGLTVIIDVFRAFSVACYVVNNGAKKIIPVGNIDIAYRLKEENPDYILIGERKGKIQPGFDYGNSPTHIENIDFSGKTIVQTTSAGTQGIVNAIKADEVISGSLVNSKAIARYIKSVNPETVSLVCMGLQGRYLSDEDIFCAEYIKSLLEETYYDINTKIASLKNSSGRRFFDPANSDWCPERDFYLCTDIDRFNFILRAEKSEDEMYSLYRVDL
ncbi:MAG TPA: 2-phosphosulfolactate phosphatase [Clostridiaceae bacterium]|nr:2-phosphosulfolactate phosphatase [Clostridiaceae bacterium]